MDSVLTNIATAIDQNFSVTKYFINTSGLYLHTQPIPQDGTIIQLRMFGYLKNDYLQLLNDSNTTNSSDTTDTSTESSNITKFTFSALPFTYLLVYRPDSERNIYSLLHGPTLVAHELVPGVLPSNGSLNWPVNEGDKVGVLIPSTCVNSSRGLMCPLHVNLRTVDGDCSTALFSSRAEDELGQIPKDEFEVVNLKLNVEAVISPSSKGIRICYYKSTTEVS